MEFILMAQMHPALHKRLVERAIKYTESLKSFPKYEINETAFQGKVDLVLYYESGKVVTKPVSRYNIGHLAKENSTFKLKATPDFNIDEKDDVKMAESLKPMFEAINLGSILLTEFTYEKIGNKLVMKSKPKSLCYYAQANIEIE